MKSDFLIAITQLSAEKNLPKEVVLQAVEAALVSAYRKDSFAANQNISVKIMPTTGEVVVYAQKTVVERVSDARAEISLAQARKLKKDVQVGEALMVEATPQNAGRIAAQTAKQVVLQRLREAERDAIFEEYAGKEGDVVSSVVQRMEPKQIVVDLGRAEAVLPISEQVRTEHYRVGMRLKVYLVEVSRAGKGPQVVVSRSHRNLLRRLFEMEVPEIAAGTVEIKAIAREPGRRSKVAVVAKQEGVDAVGCCVGMRGIRIQNITSELHGEKIDVVQWHGDARTFIANALSPAQVVEVIANEAEKAATVIVPDRQLSLAIGKEGQNARLAAKLTGWRIDIKSVTTAEEEKAARAAESGAAPAQPAAVAVEQAVAAATAVATPAAEAAPVAPAAPPEEVAAAPAASVEAPAPEMAKAVAPVPEVEPAVAEAVQVAEQAEEEIEYLPEEEEEAKEPVHSVIRFAEEILPQRARGGSKKSKRRSEKDERATTKARKAQKPAVTTDDLDSD